MYLYFHAFDYQIDSRVLPCGFELSFWFCQLLLNLFRGSFTLWGVVQFSTFSTFHCAPPSVYVFCQLLCVACEGCTFFLSIVFINVIFWWEAWVWDSEKRDKTLLFNFLLMLKLLCWITTNRTNFYLFLFSLKIFVPITVVALLILIPVNVSSGTLFFLKRELVVSDIDKLSISNVPPESIRYVFLKLPPKN